MGGAKPPWIREGEGAEPPTDLAKKGEKGRKGRKREGGGEAPDP